MTVERGHPYQVMSYTGSDLPLGRVYLGDGVAEEIAAHAGYISLVPVVKGGILDEAELVYFLVAIEPAVESPTVKQSAERTVPDDVQHHDRNVG